MGIIDNYSKLIKLNIKDQLKQAEDPKEKARELLSNAEKDMESVREEVLDVLNSIVGCNKLINNCEADAAHFREMAEKAKKNGAEDDSWKFDQKADEYDEKMKNAAKKMMDDYKTAEKYVSLYRKLEKDAKKLREASAGVM